MFRINKGVFWLKLGYGLFAMGLYTVLPFLALQMSNQGLSDEDISFILGIMPLSLVFISPFIGMLGDKFGYKYIISAHCILIGVSTTAFHFVPHFQEGNLQYAKFNLTAKHELYSIMLPLCNVSDCKNTTEVFDKPGFMQELEDYISSTFNISNLTIPEFGTVNETKTFCLLQSVLQPQNTTEYILHDVIKPCDPNFGNHSLTFWTMMSLVFIFKVNLIGGASMLDGVSQIQAAKHDSNYNYIFFYVIAFQALSPLVSSLTIKDTQGTEDYSLMYFVSDGILFIALLIFLFAVDFTNPNTTNGKQEPLTEALPKLLSVPFLILIFGTFVTGLQWGIHDSFLFLYLQEDLKADSKLLSYMATIGMVTQAIFVPFSGKLIKKIGTVNAIFLNLMVESSRFLIYSWVQQRPPYYALALHALDFTMWSFSWIAIVDYGFLITPPTIAATMTSVIQISEFIIAKSLGTFIGGQLRNVLTRPELFRWTALVTAGLGLIYYGLYYFLARPSEHQIIEEINKKYPRQDQ